MPVNFINQFGGLLIIMKNRIFGLVMASVLTVLVLGAEQIDCRIQQFQHFVAAEHQGRQQILIRKGAVLLKMRQMLRHIALYVRLFLSMTGSAIL